MIWYVAFGRVREEVELQQRLADYNARQRERITTTATAAAAISVGIAASASSSSGNSNNISNSLVVEDFPLTGLSSGLVPPPPPPSTTTTGEEIAAASSFNHDGKISFAEITQVIAILLYYDTIKI